MGNYRKSILSVAAAVAISSTVLTAAYLPLTNTTKDNSWVLFGVNGFKTNGAIIATPGAFSVALSAATAITDTAGDDLYTAGLTVTGKDFGRLEALGASDIEIRVDTTDVIWDETEPFRTIYVDATGDTLPDFAFTYKASLEGKTLEYQISGSDAGSVVINSVNVYNNPALGETIDGTGSNPGTSLSTIADTIDYDFTGNPPLVAQYDQAANQTLWSVVGPDETLRLYSYDAVNKKWDIYDRANNATTNDFLSFTKGKGYWGKIDADSNNLTTNTDSQEAGFVLGSSVLAPADYTAAGITDGWNLISFDSSVQEIRYASTGIIATITVGADVFTLTDSSGNHTVTVTLAASDSMAAVAKKTNSAISQAIALGTMPKTFNLRAFPVSATQIAFISNKKFTLKDTNDALITVATTLNGGVLLDPATLIDTTNGADVTAVGVMSKYGEFAMIIEALHGAITDSIQPKALGSSVEITAGATPAAEVFAIGGTNAATTATLTASLEVNATEIDTNIDGTLDKILITSANPFYLRDHTFSRVFTYTDSAVNGTIAITNPAIANQTITAAARTDAIDVSGDINTAGLISAGTPSDDLTKIVFSIDTADGNAFNIAETVGDHLTVSSTSSDMAKGAVKGIYSVNFFAEKEVTNNVDINITTVTEHADANMTITYGTVFNNTIVGTRLNTGDANLTASDADYEAFLDALVTQITTDLDDNNITYTSVDHNYTASGGTPDDDLLAAVITISGSDVIAAFVDYNGTVGTDFNGTADLGYITLSSTDIGDLSSDLKYNAIYTPNYVMEGPLYTMRDNGMALKALVTGVTNLTDSTVAWDSIDLTRKPSEWLLSQDYNLFKTDDTSGYWAYLVTDTDPNPISITNASIARNYSHHFDTNGNTYNHYAGQLSVTITGISDDDNRLSARVVADIAGETIELVRESVASDVYTGNISAYETYNFALNTAYDVKVTVADGLGNNYSAYLGASSTVTAPALNLAAFDNVKPATPSISTAGLNVTAALSGAAGIYIFQDAVPENYAAGDELFTIADSTATITNVCKDMTAVTTASTSSKLVAIAFDGNGVWLQGNASDQNSTNYMPILKDRVYATNTNTGSKSITVGGADYNTSCQVASVIANTGLTISSITDDKIAKIAYDKVAGSDLLTSVPITVYLSAVSGTTSIVEIKYDGAYVGKTAFVMIDGKTYTWTFESEANIIAGAGGESDNSPRNITASIKTGITF